MKCSITFDGNKKELMGFFDDVATVLKEVKDLKAKQAKTDQQIADLATSINSLKNQIAPQELQDAVHTEAVAAQQAAQQASQQASQTP
jgi:t-SNARE complex subunit (syntaxin)